MDQSGIGIAARVGSKQTVLIGENDQHIRLHLVGHQGCQRVVIAKAQLVGDYRVVLIDDWHHPHLQQRLQGAARIQVTFATAVVVVGQQYLRGLHTVFLKAGFPGLYQPGLAHSRGCLQLVQRCRAFHPAQLFHTGGDGT